MINVLLFKLQENQIPEKFWLLFEFICYSCSEKTLYQNRVYQNPFLNYLKSQNPENYDLYEVYIELLRNYVEKGITQITTTQDELGNNYLDLLTELITFIQDNSNLNSDNENFNSAVFLFETILVSKLRVTSL